MSNVQLSRKVCFYYNSTSGEILTGFPEQYPAPRGYEKIVCNSAHEAEIWSERQRKYDNFKHTMIQEQRELIEGPQREAMRSQMRSLMANARNNTNREFLRRALETTDVKAGWKYARESFLHAEAYESGR